MKQIRALLEGDQATKPILENEGYCLFGFFGKYPIYQNERNKIVVHNEEVRMVYSFGDSFDQREEQGK